MADFQELYFANLIYYNYELRKYRMSILWDWMQKNRPNDVFVMIVAYHQIEYYKTFLKALQDVGGKIIHESEQAVNSNYPSSGPRNKVVVWEFKQPDIQPVPVVEKKVKTPAATTSSTSQMVVPTASPVDITKQDPVVLWENTMKRPEFVPEPGAV